VGTVAGAEAGTEWTRELRPEEREVGTSTGRARSKEAAQGVEAMVARVVPAEHSAMRRPPTRRHWSRAHCSPLCAG